MMQLYPIFCDQVAPAAVTTTADDSTIVELLNIATDQRRRRLAFNLCDRAQNRCAWLMADRLARAWELGGCEALGVPVPEEGGRR